MRHGSLLVAVRRGVGIPLRAQLERALRVSIQTGRLQPGCAMPSTRLLAEELGVSRGVVVGAYEQLLAEGYLHSRRATGTYVSKRRSGRVERVPDPELASPPRFDLRPGRPDPSLFPRRNWLSAFRQALATAPAPLLDYPDARGVLSARTALAEYLNRARATAAVPNQILLCNGFAQGMRLVGESLRARGVRRIAVEDPGHAYESADVQASGLEMAAVPVDERGLNVDRLARLRVGAVLTTPAHQYPTGAVLPPERRAALLAWAHRQNAFIVEDDYDGEYRYDRDPIGALQGLDPGRVIYIGSTSKTLSPALRMGWVLSPASLISDLTRRKLDADRGSPAFEQLALAEFIRRGDLDRHLRRTRLIYSRRRTHLAEVLARCLPGLRIRGVAAGLHLILELPEGAQETRVAVAAKSRGILVRGIGAYRARGDAGTPALLLGYCRLADGDVFHCARLLAESINSTLASSR